MVFSSFLIRAAVITTIVVLVSSCGPSDSRPPWDTDQMQQLRKAAWFRVAAEEPRCGLAGASN